MESSRASTGPLRVCLILRDEPGMTGTVRYVDCLEAGLAGRGFEVIRLLTRPRGAPARLLGVASSALSVDAIAFLSAYPVRLSWPSADIYHFTVHTYTSALAFHALPGPTVATVHDLGVLLEANDGLPRTLSRVAARVGHRLSIRGLSRVDAVITDSQWTKETLSEQISFPADRVTVAVLGVAHDRMRPLRVPRAFRRRYDLSGDRPYLLYVGSDEPRKNLPTLWRALSIIRRRYPDVILLKVGRGYDPAARSALQRLSAQLEIERNIRYLEEVPEADLPFFYNLAEMLLMPSLYEGFGLPALEAMACGTPVVVSDRGSLPEIVGADAGLTVDPLDANAIARAALRILADHRLAAHLGARGRVRSRTFTWDATVDRTIATYEHTLVMAGGGRLTADVR